MTSWKQRMAVNLHWKKLFQYFFQGLVIIAPLGVTIYAVFWLFTTVDNILPNIIQSIFPNLLREDGTGELKRIPGIGFLVVIFIVMLVGRVSSSFVMSKLVDLLDGMLERTPGIKFIYSSVKDFLEAFTGNKRKFDRPVLVSVDANEVWRIGFITQEDAGDFELKEHAVVYIPLSYALTGVTYIVPKQKIKLLNNIGSGEAMKFAVSGGVSKVE
ncbi:MAG TPA: DUF502 domain-containing protein [Panacibacter sp.]|nr:DUF502 domain-containing protein [Panacibacter sp.]HNP44843.1 DUF502 domain-containing protein [Panacibacter sp.]